MTRKGGAKYTSMESPQPGQIRIPDMALLSNKKQKSLVQEIAVAARQNLAAIAGSTGGTALSQALGKLEYRLLDLLNPGKSEDPPGTPAIIAGARLGYVIGVMENGSGVAHEGRSESHYTTAMVIISSELSQSLPPTAMSEFATECGYYLARTNDQSLAALADLATARAELLRG